MRKEGWEKELDNYLQETMNRHFAWGDMDCLIFVSDACEKLSGIDPMKKKLKSDPETIRGLYDSENGAMELIKKYRKSMRHIMDVHFERIKPSFAQRGDVVMAELENGLAFGLNVGRGKCFFKMKTEGYLTKPLSECLCAWRVE